MHLSRRFSAFLLAGGLVATAHISACSDDPIAGGESDSGVAETSDRPDTGGGIDGSIPDAGREDTGTDAGSDAADAGPTCGNGTVDVGEACDLGTALNTGAYGGCNANCTKAPFCGDSIMNGAEECDKGTANNSAIGACSMTCMNTSLLLWLDAADPNGNGVLPADNDALAAWVDKGRGVAVVQATVARQPKWRTAGINAKPAFELDGIDDHFDVDLDINGALRPDLTVVVVFQNFAGNTSQYSGLWGQDNGGWDRFMGTGGLANVNGVSTGTNFAAVMGLTAEATPLVVTTVLRADMANMSTVHVNAVLGATFTGSVQPGMTRMSIGSINGPDNFAATHVFDGYISEVRIYGEALSDANRMALETALMTKYVP